MEETNVQFLLLLLYVPCSNPESTPQTQRTLGFSGELQMSFTSDGVNPN